MRRALIVGIDDYSDTPLSGCVNDANKIAEMLRKNHDGSQNFECKVMTAPGEKVQKATLKKNIQELFAHEADVALLFFAGHGTVNNLGGYLVTQDAAQYDEGVSMQDVLSLANQSPVHEVVIILDCCHSGALGAVPALGNSNDLAHLRQGVSVLTASRDSQPSVEENGSGVFTTLVCAALDGGASDVIGDVTVASVYAYVDQVLGAWDQRPLFKSHVAKLIPLRTCKPVVDLPILRLLPKYFPDPSHEFPLDPSYEPDAEPDHPEHEEIFGHLQKYRAARLLVPVGEEHMYFAAMNSKSCKLTPLGQFYLYLANSGKL